MSDKKKILVIQNIHDAGIQLLKEKYIESGGNFRDLTIEEGIELIKEKHADITLITASIDEKLNESWYIVPGLGDMGDRLFGTT